jgi:hypothetical protein
VQCDSHSHRYTLTGRNADRPWYRKGSAGQQVNGSGRTLIAQEKI